MNRTKPIDPPRDWQSLKPHPFAELCEFGVGIDMEAIVHDMMNEGYDDREPIVLLRENGCLWILNGRHRHNCAIKAEVVPCFVEYTGKDPLNEAARKLMQQHLDVSQRALFAAKMRNAREGRPESTPRNREVDSPTITRAQAAKRFQVSTRAVDYGTVVEDHGTENLKLAVRMGKVKVSDAAKVARRVEAIQDYAVGAVERGEFSTVAQAATLCNPCVKRVKKSRPPITKCPECEDLRVNGKKKPEKKRPVKLGRKEKAAAWNRLTHSLESARSFLEDAQKSLGLKDDAEPKRLIGLLNDFAAEVAGWRGQVEAVDG